MDYLRRPRSATHDDDVKPAKYLLEVKLGTLRPCALARADPRARVPVTAWSQNAQLSLLEVGKFPVT